MFAPITPVALFAFGFDATPRATRNRFKHL
jgi:hypothetical protein